VAMLSVQLKSLAMMDHPSSIPLLTCSSVGCSSVGMMNREESVQDDASHSFELAPPFAFKVACSESWVHTSGDFSRHRHAKYPMHTQSHPGDGRWVVSLPPSPWSPLWPTYRTSGGASTWPLKTASHRQGKGHHKPPLYSLHAASVEELADIVKWLLSHGADVQDGLLTPLDMGAANGHLEAVRMLLEHGANVDPQNENHSTPLHLATSTGSAETVQLLFKHWTDRVGEYEPGITSRPHTKSRFHGTPTTPKCVKLTTTSATTLNSLSNMTAK